MLSIKHAVSKIPIANPYAQIVFIVCVWITLQAVAEYLFLLLGV